MNNNIFSKTKESLIKINILVVGSFLIIFSFFIYTYFQGLTYNNIDKILHEELESITLQLKNSSIFYPVVVKDPQNMIYVYEDDRIRYYSENRYFEELLPPRNSDKVNTVHTYKEGKYTFRELNVNIGEYNIQIIRNINVELNSLRQLIFVFIIGIIIALISTYLIALYLTKKALVPIETAWDNQVKFIQDASHELKTPIAIVSSKLETLFKTPNKTISEEAETIADAMKETRRVKKMIGDLLSLSKEDSIVKLNIESIDIKALLDEITNDYIEISQMQEKELNCKYSSSENIIISDKNKLRQLILIFIDNAFKYTNEGDSILINVIEKGNNVIIQIMDSGIGIKEEEIKYIFNRFFRSDSVRNQDIGGSGIGLSIAKVLSSNLNIRITVESKIEKGTKFDIIIPKSIKNNKAKVDL